MKAELAPKLTQKVGTNYVLWFEGKNTYVVLSQSGHQLLTCYLESKDDDAFIEYIEHHFHISKEQGQSYLSDMESFLQDMNISVETEEKHVIPESIPHAYSTKFYTIGNAKIAIHFSSEKLVQLIHPYLQHASVPSMSNPVIVFDIFEKEKSLYLLKNKSFVGYYEMVNFHFLQGKFAMELVTSIYGNTESDWLATFHASTICNNKEAIMIIGDSGNGKSTLSAVLMAHGFDLLADDFTPMLSKNQHLYRFPAAISIKQGAFPIIESLFEDFKKEQLHVSSSKQMTVKYLPPSQPFETSQKHFECQKIVLVKYDKDLKSEIRECAPEKILQIFIPDSWISPQPKHSKQFLKWLSELKFYELTYSDNMFAVAKFEELFEAL